MKWLFFLVPLLLFGEGLNLPKPYLELIEKILPPHTEVSINFYGDTLRGVIKEYTREGYIRIDLSGDDFISFYDGLYQTFLGKQPQKVSLTVYVKGEKLPYNPFFQLWDRTNGVRILKFSRLQPGCKPPVVKIEAEGIAGAKVWTTFEEIKRKLFEGGFKYPAYYCY